MYDIDLWKQMHVVTLVVKRASRRLWSKPGQEKVLVEVGKEAILDLLVPRMAKTYIGRGSFGRLR